MSYLPTTVHVLLLIAAGLCFVAAILGKPWPTRLALGLVLLWAAIVAQNSTRFIGQLERTMVKIQGL